MISTILSIALLFPVPPCEYEDGSSQTICVWDARHMGNGRGHSVLIVNGGTDRMVTIRIPHRLAHQMRG